MGSEERLWALAMGVLCLRWLGSGVEGSVASWWDMLDSGTIRPVRVIASVRYGGAARSEVCSGAVRAGPGPRRWLMVLINFGPSGRPWRLAVRIANDKNHMAVGLGKSATLNTAMALSARSDTRGGLGCCAPCSNAKRP